VLRKQQRESSSNVAASSPEKVMSEATLSQADSTVDNDHNAVSILPSASSEQLPYEQAEASPTQWTKPSEEDILQYIKDMSEAAEESTCDETLSNPEWTWTEPSEEDILQYMKDMAEASKSLTCSPSAIQYTRKEVSADYVPKDVRRSSLQFASTNQ